MSRGGVRIIDGAHFDAWERACRLMAEARGQAGASRVHGGAHGGAGQGAGRVSEIVGLVVRARMPGPVRHGDVVHIVGAHGPIPAEVVGFRESDVTLAVLGDIHGIAAGARVLASGHSPTIQCGPGLLGRVLDGLGRPLDQGPDIAARSETRAVLASAPNPLDRPIIDRVLETGVRAIDGLCTLGLGQRIGIFAGPGVGKSSLLARIARAAPVDVCVLCTVGERGREVREFLDERLSPSVRARTVAVVATSDAPSLVRVRAATTAMAVAEWFRARQGAHVLLTLDSLTRLARAQREVGLAAGEMPTRHGFPPSVFAMLPRLVERAGPFARGSITGIFTVLEARESPDPIAEEARAILDGHIVLDGARAARGCWPAIDILASVSRVMGSVTTAEHQRAAARVRALVASHRANADLVRMGAYAPGSDPVLDTALARRPAIDAFLYHEDATPYAHCVERLEGLSTAARK